MRLTHKRLKQYLKYSKKTGHFYWKKRPPYSHVKIGDKAGSYYPCGYWYVSIFGKSYRASRLAWFYVNKKWPKYFIDHKDRNKLNNKWKNLREATNSQNQRNSKLHESNTSGIRGVHFQSGRHNKWRATFSLKGKRKHLGYFDKKSEAAKAYRIAAERYYKEFLPAA